MAAVVLLTRLLGHNSMQQRIFLYLRLMKRQCGFHIKHNHGLSYSLSRARCLGLCLRCNSSSSFCNSPGDDKSTRGILSPLVLSKFSTKTPATECPKPDPKTTGTTSPSTSTNNVAKMGLFARFKHMYKQYWYVLIPVHMLTSIGWLGGFYYLSKSGVDISALLHYFSLSESTIESIQRSGMGHYAFVFLCYKLSTPLRYTLTLGCTTVSIKYLAQRGYIKPLPTKTELIKMYEDKNSICASAKADKAEEENGSK